MKSLHTPGPWTAEPPDHVDIYGNLVQVDLFTPEYWFISGPGADVHGLMTAADARLIAAAPDLLEALKKAEALCTSVFESNWRNWEELASPDEFERWAKRRCAHAAIYLKEAIANARLIAAAPDLLDALAVLTELVSFQICGDGHPAIINARAAIAKATGGAS